MNTIDRSKSNIKVKQRTKKKIERTNISKTRRNIEQDNAKDSQLIFGIDNGATGTIACVCADYNYIDFIETPVKESYDYTKDVQKMNRVDTVQLLEWFKKHINFVQAFYKTAIKIIVILERPMVNPQRFKQSGYALRAFEATLIVLEMLKLNYIIIDSKKWQHYFFGKDTTQVDLKKASMKKSLEILTDYEKENIYGLDIKGMKQTLEQHKDGDGFLICYYAKNKLI